MRRRRPPPSRAAEPVAESRRPLARGRAGPQATCRRDRCCGCRDRPILGDARRRGAPGDGAAHPGPRLPPRHRQARPERGDARRAARPQVPPGGHRPRPRRPRQRHHRRGRHEGEGRRARHRQEAPHRPHRPGARGRPHPRDRPFVRLEERARLANVARGDLFISIHCNSLPQRHIRGIETYTLNLASDRYAIRLAARENATSEKGMSDLQFLLADLATRANTEESVRLATQVQSGPGLQPPEQGHEDPRPRHQGGALLRAARDEDAGHPGGDGLPLQHRRGEARSTRPATRRTSPGPSPRASRTSSATATGCAKAN